MSRTVAVIPCGGAGTRLWPRSRRSAPKHILPLSGSGKPLLRETYERIRPLVDDVLFLTEERQLPLIREILPELDADRFVVEPSARGTTNALGLAALTILERSPDALMMSLPADHVIRGVPAYRRAVRTALRVAESSRQLVTVGLRPAYPATGFGYIKARGEGRALKVERFVEKPDQETASRFLEEGGYFWNLAMFAWPVQEFWKELERHGPQHARGLRRVLKARAGGDEAAAGRAYNRLPVEAVDYTVMEKTDRLLLVPAAFEWVDVGSWSELADLLRADEHGNVVEGDTVLIGTANSLISAPGKLVAAIGLEGMVVVDSPDALLIMPKARAQDVKKVVDALRRAKKTQYL